MRKILFSVLLALCYCLLYFFKVECFKTKKLAVQDAHAAHTFPSRLPKETRSLPPSSPGRARSTENLLQKIVEAEEKK